MIGYWVPWMLRLGWFVCWSLVVLPLAAQQVPVLPEIQESEPPDTITPVPLPEIPFGSPDLLKPTLPETLMIDNKGSQTADLEGGVTFGGPVKISGDNGLEVFADTARLVLADESVVLEGHVSVYQGNTLQRGDRAVYYYARKFLDATDLSISTDPIIMEAGKFTVQEQGGRQVYVGTDAGITLHDVEKPNFWVKADQTTIYPGDKITFKNLKLYAGDVPVFWLPYLSQPLHGELGYHFIPGARSSWGGYLLNSYGIMLGGTPNPETGENENAWLLSKWHLDLRTLRGVGAGLDLIDTRIQDNKNLTGLSLYYLNDLNPSESRSGLPRGFVNEDRYQYELKHRVEFDMPDDASWYLDANLNVLSDDYYLEDFRPDIYQTDPSPDNMMALFRRDETSLFSLTTRFQANDFQRTATRLPELAFEQSRRPLFGLPVLHEGSTSLGILGVSMADATRWGVVEPLLALPAGDPREAALLNQLHGPERELAKQIRALPAGDPRIAGLRNQLFDTGFTRFHTYQDFSLPMTLGGWLNLTPQAGIGYTRYMAVDGPAKSDSRLHLHAGAEASVKFSRTLESFKNRQWGMDGLLHVVQPYVNWSVLSSDEAPALYPRVDRLTFSTRPPTLSPERFTATDDMQNWNIMRLGVRNHLLTRRDGQAHEWLFMDSYIDAYMNDPDMDRTFSNFYNDLRFEPVPWLSLGLETQFPLFDSGSGFSEVATYLRYQPTPNVELGLSYRWLDNHPVLLDSNRVDLRGFVRLNEHWGVGVQQVWEMSDGTLELQQYTLHRDLGNWVLGIGLSSRDNRVEQEYGVMFSLSLKDLPSVSLPFRVDAN